MSKKSRKHYGRKIVDRGGHVTDQVEELTQELNDVIRNRERYKEAWEQEIKISKRYKDLADKQRKAINVYRTTLTIFVVVYALVLILMLWK